MFIIYDQQHKTQEKRFQTVCQQIAEKLHFL